MFILRDISTDEKYEFAILEQATAKIAELKAEILVKEQDRFTVVREILHGNDSTWVPADFELDPEACNYFVFNTFTGQHEKTHSLSLARSRLAELQSIFTSSLTFIIIEEPST